MPATPTHDNVPLSGDPLIDGIVQGSSWVDAGHVTLTYSFSNDVSGGGFQWNPAEKAQLAQALNSWAAVADISFVEVPGAGANFPASQSDITFIAAGFSGEPGLLGIGFFPDPDFVDQEFDPVTGSLGSQGYTRANYPQPEGDIFLFDGDQYFPNLNPGSLGFEAAVHEIGHTLGMKHPHDDGGNGRPLLPLAYDDAFDTVMSYNDPQQITGSPPTLLKGYVTTPMPLDILAIQYIYGVNYNYHTGNDTYYLKSDGMVRTIWDAGGIDTLNAAAIIAPTTFDLNGGSLIDHGDGYSFTALAYFVTDGFGNVVNYIENILAGTNNDIIIGNDADNSIDGNTGSDTMSGGLGDDTYFVNVAGDVVVENAGEGTDTVNSAVNYDLTLTELENLTLTGGTAKVGTGNDYDNILIGNGAANTLSAALGNDTLNGGAGIDTMTGGDGNDVYYVDNAKDVIIELAGEGNDTVFSKITLTLGAEIDNLTLNGTAGANGTGNALDNIITGNNFKNNLFGLGGADTLDGGGSDDTLDGGTGNDDMTGGLGNDVFIVDSTTDIVRDSTLGDGNDLVKASASFSLAGPEAAGVERLTLTGAGNIDGTGNALVNVITGNSGNNILDGGTGADFLVGGAGNDTYVVDDMKDKITDTSGNDTVVTGISFLINGYLPTGIENVTFTGGANLNVTGGNSAANVLTGNAGVNTLDGGLGADTLDGGLSNDLLIGGKGHDVMTGGAGADVFQFNAAPNAADTDTITDFTGGPGGDVLDLHHILSGYTGVITDYVQVTQVGLDTIVKVDTNGLAGGSNFVQIATLTNVNLGTDEAALVVAGNLTIT